MSQLSPAGAIAPPRTASHRRRRAARIAAAVAAATLGITLLQGSPAFADTVTDGNGTSYDREFSTSADWGYQIAYSEEQDWIWTTATTHDWGTWGYPIASHSTLQAYNASTGAIVKTITLPTISGSSPARVEAGYGLAVDDTTNSVWITSSREDKVYVYTFNSSWATYTKNTISSIATGRDIVIDTVRQTAFISSPRSDTLYEYNSSTLAHKATLTASYLGLSNFSPMSLAITFDATTSLVYTVNLDDGKLIELNHAAGTNRVVTTFPSNTESSGVAIDLSQGTAGYAYVATQGTKKLYTVDIATGNIINTVTHTDALLNVTVDTASGRVYSTAFGTTSVPGSDVLVTSASTGAAIGAIDLGAQPNDALFAAGKLWVIDRGGHTDVTGGNSRLWRLTKL